MNNKLIHFKKVSDKCYQTMLKSWFEIEKVVSQPNGLEIQHLHVNIEILTN